MTSVNLAADDLDDRIAAAFRDGATSSHVSTLLSEAEIASAQAEEWTQQTRRRALDPTLTTSAVLTARQDMEDAAFRRERFQTGVARLRQRVTELKAQEEDARRRTVYEKVKAERDALAAELKKTYPRIAEQLTELLARVTVNDRHVEHLNAHAIPTGAQRLLVAELVARDLLGFAASPTDVPRITQTLRLPSFEYRQHEPFAWPK